MYCLFIYLYYDNYIRNLKDIRNRGISELDSSNFFVSAALQHSIGDFVV